MDKNLNDLPCLTFRTKGDWSVENVMTLASDASTIYNVFLAFEIKRRQEDQYLESIEKSLKYYHRYFDHPMYHDLYHIWREILHDWRKGRYPFPPPGLFPFPAALPFHTGQIEQRYPSATEIFENISSYSVDSDRLQVYRIRMASPGGFSFTGIGELIREFRELIKDIWYRNKQEKAKGQLEIIEKYLCVRREYPDSDLPPPSTIIADRKLVNTVNRHIESLQNLERSGKIVSVSEHIDSKEI